MNILIKSLQWGRLERQLSQSMVWKEREGGGGAQGELIMSYSMAGLFWAFIILPARPYLSFSRTELPVLPLLDLEEKFILWWMVEINSNPNILTLQSTHHRVFAINHSHCMSRNISFSKIKIIKGNPTLGAKGWTPPLKNGPFCKTHGFCFVLTPTKLRTTNLVSKCNHNWEWHGTAQPEIFIVISPLNAGRYPRVLGKVWSMPAHTSSALHLSKGLATQG